MTTAKPAFSAAVETSGRFDLTTAMMTCPSSTTPMVDTWVVSSAFMFEKEGADAPRLGRIVAVKEAKAAGRCTHKT